MRQAWVLLLAATMVAGVAWGQGASAPPPAPAPAVGGDTGKAIADLAAKNRNSLGIVRFTVEDELGGPSVDVAGMGICVAAEGEKGTLITTALNPMVLPSSVKRVQVMVPGSDKTLDGVYVVTDPETGVTFVEATGPVKWQAVTFAPSVSLPVGKQVFSVGLQEPALGLEPYLGAAYVSSRVRVPGPLVYVTGGKLTNVGSPVFTADGTAVGIVLQQLPNVVDIRSQGGGGSVVLTDQRESSWFTPVEEFAQVLKNRPVAGKRPPWLGILGLQPHPEDIIPLGVPAVRVVKVVPDSPAGKAGLKDKDTITGFNGQALERLATQDLTTANFQRQLNRLAVGSTVELTVLEAQKPKVLKMTVESMPPLPREAKKYPSAQLGMVVREKVKLDEALDPNPTAKEKGLYVVVVAGGSPAAIAGLKGEPDYNLVTSVNGQPVETRDKFKEIVEGELAKDPKKPINMAVRKGALSESVTITPR